MGNLPDGSNIDKKHKRHHPWCNHFAFGDPENCNSCKSLFEQYPIDGMNDNELMWKYFPSVAADNEIPEH